MIVLSLVYFSFYIFPHRPNISLYQKNTSFVDSEKSFDKRSVIIDFELSISYGIYKFSKYFFMSLSLGCGPSANYITALCRQFYIFYLHPNHISPCRPRFGYNAACTRNHYAVRHPQPAQRFPLFRNILLSVQSMYLR